jgi:hypothetical protein
LLNDEGASILEVLEAGPASAEAIGLSLSADSGVDVGTLTEVVTACWPQLIEAGLVREQLAERAIA